MYAVLYRYGLLESMHCMPAQSSRPVLQSTSRFTVVSAMICCVCKCRVSGPDDWVFMAEVSVFRTVYSQRVDSLRFGNSIFLFSGMIDSMGSCHFRPGLRSFQTVSQTDHIAVSAPPFKADHLQRPSSPSPAASASLISLHLATKRWEPRCQKRVP